MIDPLGGEFDNRPPIPRGAEVSTGRVAGPTIGVGLWKCCPELLNEAGFRWRGVDPLIETFKEGARMGGGAIVAFWRNTIVIVPDIPILGAVFEGTHIRDRFTGQRTVGPSDDSVEHDPIFAVGDPRSGMMLVNRVADGTHVEGSQNTGPVTGAAILGAGIAVITGVGGALARSHDEVVRMGAGISIVAGETQIGVVAVLG